VFHRRVRALILLALLGFGACASGPHGGQADACALIRLARVPLETHGGMVFVQAMIDHQPVPLLVDTGAERTLLTEAAVDRLHLPRDRERATRTFGIGSPTAAWDAKLPNGLVLGGTHFPVESVTVGRFGMNDVAGGLADGLLGADTLLAFDIDLDLPGRQMTFYRARPDCGDPAPPWHGPYVDVAGVGVQRDRLLVPFELDGLEGMAVFDTGAQISSISRAMAERIGLGALDMASDRTVLARGAGPDQVEVHIHRFRELRVGAAVMLSPALPVVPMSNRTGDGLIGADFLRARRVWLSFTSQRMFVAPLPHGPWIAATGAEE
jgi:predicted aspartyl protease